MTQGPSPAAVDTTRPVPATVQDAGWREALQAWDYTQMSGELVGAWACALGVWGDYVHRLGAAKTPLAVLDAGARFMTDCLDVSSRAAGARLRDGGLDAPLLNDA